jgi:hypothetical protein
MNKTSRTAQVVFSQSGTANISCYHINQLTGADFRPNSPSLAEQFDKSDVADQDYGSSAG